MSATKALPNVASVFPVGTNVGAYPKTNFLQRDLPPSGAAPPGAATESQTVASDGSLTFVALLPNTTYFLYAQVSGAHRYMRIVTPKLGRVAVSTAASTGDKAIRAAVPGRRIVVEGYLLSSGGAQTGAKWRSGTNDISGALKFADSGGASHPATEGAAPLETRPGEALNLNQAAAISVFGHIVYTLEPKA